MKNGRQVDVCSLKTEITDRRVVKVKQCIRVKDRQRVEC